MTDFFFFFDQKFEQTSRKNRDSNFFYLSEDFSQIWNTYIQRENNLNVYYMILLCVLENMISHPFFPFNCFKQKSIFIYALS